MCPVGVVTRTSSARILSRHTCPAPWERFSFGCLSGNLSHTRSPLSCSVPLILGKVPLPTPEIQELSSASPPHPPCAIPETR